MRTTGKIIIGTGIMAAWLIFLVPGLLAATEPGDPYRITEKDTLLEDTAQGIKYVTMAKITAWDDRLVFTDRGDLEWVVGYGEAEWNRLKALVTALNGQEAVITFIKLPENPFPQVLDLDEAEADDDQSTATAPLF